MKKKIKNFFCLSSSYRAKLLSKKKAQQLRWACVYIVVCTVFLSFRVYYGWCLCLLLLFFCIFLFCYFIHSIFWLFLSLLSRNMEEYKKLIFFCEYHSWKNCTLTYLLSHTYHLFWKKINTEKHTNKMILIMHTQ